MEISATNSQTSPLTGTEPTTADGITSDFETFLKMLTVQLKNQDPLDPMDSADFSMQLATFSGVEQQVKTNDLLTALTQQADAAGLAQISGWIGMQALAATSADFSGSPLEVHVAPEHDAETAFLIVKNDFGQEVDRQAIDLKAGSVDWQGIGADGQAMLSGSYSFFVESYEGKDLLSTQQAKVFAAVSEVKSDAGTLSVTLATGDTFAADRIEALRSPPVAAP